MNPLPAQLPIQPITHPVAGSVTLPGSKSLTNRALLLAALCDAPVTLTGALFSEDTELMTIALRALGLTIETDESTATIRVSAQQKLFHSAICNPHSAFQLNIGLAGTAARFLTALCAAAPRGIYRIDGVPQMRKRPMRGLLDALRSLGADIRCPGEEHHFPIEIHARGLRGGAVEIDATESSQMLSALLMVSPLAAAPLDIRLSAPVREPFVQMTKTLMTQFGWSGADFQPANVAQAAEPARSSNAGSQSINPELSQASPPRPAPPPHSHPTHPCRSPGAYAIEPDATAASYYLALPLVTGGALTLNSLRAPAPDSLQGDIHFATILQHHGLNLHQTPTGLNAECGMRNAEYRTPAGHDEPLASGIPHSAFRNPQSAIRIPHSTDFSAFSDTFLTLAAIAPLLPCPVRITGIAHTRKQETDRVAGMARELTRLGQHVIETDDSLEIHPRPLIPNQTIETYHDHRFAMSFAILGCHDLHGDGRPWLTIDNPACCAKTFPGFFELLATLRTRNVAAS